MIDADVAAGAGERFARGTDRRTEQTPSACSSFQAVCVGIGVPHSLIRAATGRSDAAAAVRPPSSADLPRPQVVPSDAAVLADSMIRTATPLRLAHLG